ncbi:unnamed protein product, partial [Mesorhabditis belari]|uniref:Ketoreductase domain-containing protein n=1 Tax=Mesorhabditis belari TaxID=2138241 RepID=A0AAF3J7W5_9BILA
MKVVLVTGASSGIGKAAAIYFAAKGYAISITARSGDGLAATKRDCIAAGIKENCVVVTPGDLTLESTAENVVRDTIDKLGSIDVLINNAGFAHAGPLATSTVEDFDKQMNLNLRSLHQLTRLVIPHLIKSKGSIVNVSSVGSLMPVPYAGFYCMSKAALDMYTKCLAQELAPHGVRCNSINPGLVKTEFAVASGMCTPETVDAAYEQRAQLSAMGRSAKPEEIAKSIYFLASSASSFTTGTIMLVDGGRMLGPAQKTN